MDNGLKAMQKKKEEPDKDAGTTVPPQLLTPHVRYFFFSFKFGLKCFCFKNWVRLTGLFSKHKRQGNQRCYSVTQWDSTFLKLQHKKTSDWGRVFADHGEGRGGADISDTTYWKVWVLQHMHQYI